MRPAIKLMSNMNVVTSTSFFTPNKATNILNVSFTEKNTSAIISIATI